jgi:uncharacterized NAD(P)/FAD-binding protein YdhS
MDYREYLITMDKFSKWLKQQSDVPEQIKRDSEILTAGMPMPQWFADKFTPYLEKYNSVEPKQ